MDFNDWYNNKYDDDSDSPMEIDDTNAEDLEFIRNIFFSEEEEESVASGISTEQLVKSILQFAEIVNIKEVSSTTRSKEEELKVKLRESIRTCEKFLIEREITGVVKFSKKRVIFPDDLTYLDKRDYLRVLKVMEEGNAVLDLDRKPIDNKAACCFMEDAMPSNMNINLTSEFSGIFHQMVVISQSNEMFARQSNSRRLASQYLAQHFSANTAFDRLGYLVASTYYQSQQGTHLFKNFLRTLRIKYITSPEEIPEESQHWKARLTRSHSYLTGIGKPQDEKQAFWGYEALAKDGIRESQLSLGMCYFMGIGVDIDQKQGIYWVERASQGGHVGATYELAFCYLYGRGTEINYVKMLEILQPLIEKESKLACFIGSFCYCFGIGVPQDHDYGLQLGKLGKGLLLDNLGDPLKDGIYQMLESI